MKHKRSWLRLALLILGAAALVVFVLADLDGESARAALDTMSVPWMLLTVGCMLAYYAFDAGKYYLVARAYGYRQPAWDCLVTTMLGFFYSAITPFSSGGQPFQAVHLHHRGVSGGAATSIIATVYISFHSALVTLGLLGLLLCTRRFSGGDPFLLILFLVGFVVHVLLMLAAVVSAVFPVWMERVGAGLVELGLRLPILRRRRDRRDEYIARWSRFVGDYRVSFLAAREHKGALAASYGLALLQIGAYMSVAFCAYRGLGFSGEGYFPFLLTSVMLFMAVAFVPLPGASVASEGGFFVVFTRYFGDYRAVGMLIWRLATYYLTLLLGYLFVAWNSLAPRRALRRERHAAEKER